MARTLKQIETSLANDIEAINPSLDTQKGPIPDLYIRPQAAQLRQTEVQVDDLNKRYSLDYIRTRNTAALDLYGGNHGVRKSPGKPARGYVYFYAYSRLRAGEILVIPAGTVVSTADTTVAYQTTREVVMYGDTIESFYNAPKRRYEVKAPVESLGTGEVFDVPPYRVRQASVQGIDGVENRTRIEGGVASESNESFGRKISVAFNGTALGSGDGLRRLIVNYDATRINDAKIVYSTDTQLFRRRIRRAAWDVYLIGEDEETTIDNFIGNGSKSEFVMQNQPTLSVADVKVNGVPVPFAYVPDTTDQTKLSSRSTDRVVLTAAPAPGIPVQISYSYDKLVTDTQGYVNQVQVNLYEADVLVRKALPIYLSISVSAQILSSFDDSQATIDIESIIQDFGNFTSFVDIILPDQLRDRISSQVGGISNVRITGFTSRDYGTLPIEAIEFKGNEYPVVLAEDVTVMVRR